MRTLATQMRLRRLLRVQADFHRRLHEDGTGGALASAAAARLLELVRDVRSAWGSEAGELAVPNASSYIAAKGGLAALARALAAELGAKGITSNALSPGFFATETNAEMKASPAGERQRERCPAKRWGEPWEIAAAAVFLASPAASYVNGHTLTVDGGVSATYLA